MLSILSDMLVMFRATLALPGGRKKKCTLTHFQRSAIEKQDIVSGVKEELDPGVLWCGSLNLSPMTCVCFTNNSMCDL